MHTLNLFKSHGIESYFSGCITLTLPKMKTKKTKKKYICVVDVPKSVENKIIENLKDTNIQVKFMTHNLSEKKSGFNLG